MGAQVSTSSHVPDVLSVVSWGVEKAKKHGHKVRKGKLKHDKILEQATKECGVNRSNFIYQSNDKALLDVFTHFMAMVLSIALNTQKAGSS